MPHYDARKALHDPNPLRRLALPLLPPVTLDVERMAARLARAIRQHPPEQWSALERVYLDRLLDQLEERHEPADVDAAGERFVEVLRGWTTRPGRDRGHATMIVERRMFTVVGEAEAIRAGAARPERTQIFL